MPVAKRVANARLDTRRRIRVLRTKVLAKALYGVEAAQMPETTERRLQCTVLDAAGRFRSRTRAPALALYATDLPALDVMAEILKRRLRFLARRMEQDPGVRGSPGDHKQR